MHRLISPAGAAEMLAGEIRDDLVHVHVDGDAATAGQHVDRKLREMFAANQCVARTLDRVEAACIDNVRVAIGARGGLFDRRERTNVVGIVGEDAAGESQILDSSDRMYSVKRVGRDRALAQQIFLDASPAWRG